MGAGERVKSANDMRAYRASVVAASKRGRLQSLTEKELNLKHVPVTLYPWDAQRQVQAWVRFGDHPMLVAARIVRSTPSAVGIEFRIEGQTFRAWLWANAVREE